RAESAAACGVGGGFAGGIPVASRRASPPGELHASPVPTTSERAPDTAEPKLLERTEAGVELPGAEPAKGVSRSSDQDIAAARSRAWGRRDDAGPANAACLHTPVEPRPDARDQRHGETRCGYGAATLGIAAHRKRCPTEGQGKRPPGPGNRRVRPARTSGG